MEDSIVNNNASDFVSCIKTCFEGQVSLSEVEKYEKLKLLLNNSLNLVNSKLIELRNKDNLLNITNNIDDLVVEVDNVQCFEPRGRFKLLLTSDKLLLQGKQSNVVITVKNIFELIVIPSYMSLKKEGEDYLAIHLSEPIKINNKETKYVLVNLLKSFNTTTKSKYSDNYNDFTESTVIMMGLHEVITNLTITRTQASLFNSIRDSKPYLKCHRSIQEGAIYPLSTGLVFVKPLLIIPSSDIASIKAGRGGSSGNTRYIDVVIETVQDKVYEFTNIDREELSALQAYINYLEEIARKRIKNERKLKVKEVVVINDSDNNNVCDMTTTISSPPSHHPIVVSNSHSKHTTNATSNNNTNIIVDSDNEDSDEDDDDYDPDANSDLEDRSPVKIKRKHSNSGSDKSSNSDDSSDDSSDNGSDSNSDHSRTDIPKHHKNATVLLKKQPSFSQTHYSKPTSTKKLLSSHKNAITDLTENDPKATAAVVVHVKHSTNNKNKVIDLSKDMNDDNTTTTTNKNNSRKAINLVKFTCNKTARIAGNVASESGRSQSVPPTQSYNTTSIIKQPINYEIVDITTDHSELIVVLDSSNNNIKDEYNNIKDEITADTTTNTSINTTNINNNTANTTKPSTAATKTISIMDAFLKQTKRINAISEM